jgi:hypothetical protein
MLLICRSWRLKTQLEDDLKIFLGNESVCHQCFERSSSVIRNYFPYSFYAVLLFDFEFFVEFINNDIV